MGIFEFSVCVKLNFKHHSEAHLCHKESIIPGYSACCDVVPDGLPYHGFRVVYLSSVQMAIAYVYDRLYTFFTTLS